MSTRFLNLFFSSLISFLSFFLLLGFTLTDLYAVFQGLWFAFGISALCAGITLSVIRSLYKRYTLSLKDAFFLFLALHILLFYLVRIDAFQAGFVSVFLFLMMIAIQRNQSIPYYLLLFLWLLENFYRFSIGVFIPFLFLCFCGLRFLYIRKQGFVVFTYLFLNLSLACAVMNMLQGSNERETLRILSQKEVKAIVLYQRRQTPYLGQSVRFALESCDGKSLFLAYRQSFEKPVGLIRVSVPGMKVLDVLSGESVGEMVEQNCNTKTLYFPALANENKKTRVLVLKEANLKNVIKTYPPPQKHYVRSGRYKTKRGLSDG